MRPLLVALFGCAALAAPALAQTVGGGAASALIQQAFINAYSRGRFQVLVNPTPLTNVKALGSPGLYQEFQGVGGTGKFALIKPDPTVPASTNDTLQVYSDIYTFYNNLGGVANLGYPVNDTTACPVNVSGTCNYQIFTKSLALFVYPGTFPFTYSVGDPFYTEWSDGGAIGGPLGAATSGVSNVTSVSTVAGTQQNFGGGAIYSYPAGSANPTTYTVSGAINTAFATNGGIGTIGFPTANEVVFASGLHRQFFEKARIEWTPGSTPVVLFQLAQISVSGSAIGLSLNLGATATLTANLFDTRGLEATGRTVTWSTSNGAAVTVVGSGTTATVRAVGSGVANIYVTGEGVTSAAFPVRVTAPCCAVGEGAPTSAITQAFQTAVSRNRLSVTTPNPTPVTRTGTGYVQTLTAADGSGASCVVAISDKSPVAYVISGDLYAAYVAAGGFTGSLGYPTSDASAGGTQAFESGAALAGAPVRLVPIPLATRWLSLGAETGALGAVAGDAAAFTTLGGTQGKAQTFAKGTLFGMTSGSRAGQAYYSAGLILARYLALSGPAGTLGVPVQDITANGDVQLQNFESGYIDLQPGATAAVEHFNPRKPGMSVTPSTAVPGGRVHVSLTGFAFGANLTVTVTGQPNFAVLTPGGEFAWDVVIPAAAKAATVSIQARAAGNSDTASGSYSITSLPQLQPRFTVVSGDQQTGIPGSLLAAPLTALLRDISGNPLPGIPVAFTVSPGAAAQVSPVTDGSGRVSARLRLPATGGVAVLALSAAGQVASFSALATPNSVSGVPVYKQASPQGSRIAAFAALIRYYQNLGALNAPNGFATVAGLTQFLSSSTGTIASDTGAAIANPWAATRFAGLAGGISVEAPTLDAIRDALSSGSPVLVDLSLTVDGTQAGSTTVIVTGSNADGSIGIQDPNSAFTRGSLGDYLNGFDSAGHAVQGTLAAVVRIVPTLSTPQGFVVAAPLGSAATAASASGNCTTLELSDPVSAALTTPAPIGGVRFLACDGVNPPYQASFADAKGAAVLDLGTGTSAALPAPPVSAWQITRTGATLTIAPQSTVISSVVNSAGFAPGLSPGGIFTIFGAGLSAGAEPPTLTVGAQTAPILLATPFQINARMPAALAPGPASLQLSTKLGSIVQDVTIAATAPGIFVIGTTADGRLLGAILNSADNSINAADVPVSRGQFISIYGTGLGATTARQGLQFASAPVQVLLDGNALATSFAGLTPGIAGLYQVNFQVPAALAPGVSHTLALQAGGVSSNTVALAVQ